MDRARTRRGGADGIDLNCGDRVRRTGAMKTALAKYAEAQTPRAGMRAARGTAVKITAGKTENGPS